ncbi:MAG TPA: DUF1326 domain-containing protein [Gemmataceae bacterium]|jgi:hypothetical protein|nr:DUF1326 domain-containing protein [Gemmataceae bacterium]
MKNLAASLAMMTATIVSLSARVPTITGTYVEARTSEVFAGACVVNGEAATTGREALLAWKVGHGGFNGVPLDGLAVVAAVVGDVNLSIHEIGGDAARTTAALFVDTRATNVQRDALVALATRLSGGTVNQVVAVKTVPIEFVESAHDVRVSTEGVRLVVEKHMDHDVTCGNKQWFGPLSTVERADMGGTVENAFSGPMLGTKWSDPNKRSAFFGTFAY